MLPYWILFLLPAWLAITRLKPLQTQTLRWPGYWWVAFVLLVLMIGLRHHVGADWFSYTEQIRQASYLSLEQAIKIGDPAYSLLNWLSGRLVLGPYFVNTVCATLFTWGLVVFCRAQPLPWLALVVAVPYLVMVVAMGYTRQSTAIGFAMLGLVALSNRKILLFVVFVILAATFHKSALILMPLAALADTRNRAWTATWVGATSLLFYWLMLQESVDSFTAVYIEAEYDSSGAAIRVAMNVVPAFLFLLLRGRFVISRANRIFWTWMSLGALAFVGLLVASPSSTAVDRVALYWVPLQLFVLSRLPIAMSKQNVTTNKVLVMAIVCYSAVILFIWLSFATHAQYWLPYQFYPWVWYWQ